MRILIAVALLLAGCNIQRSQIATQAKQDLVGLTKSELLRCAGVPAATYIDGAVEYLLYSNYAGSTGGALLIPSGNNLVLAPAVSNSRHCEATFAVEDGAVSSITYRGEKGSVIAPELACYAIVEPCVE